MTQGSRRAVCWTPEYGLPALGAAVALLVIVGKSSLRTKHRTQTIENAAVTRACRAVACAFAQPLTGALAYSELLMADQIDFSAAQRHELEGLREGVLRMERLLQSLRAAVHDAAGASDDRRVVDDVERAVSGPLPRLLLPSREDGMALSVCDKARGAPAAPAGWRSV